MPRAGDEKGTQLFSGLLFVKAPWGTGTEFVKKAIENDLLIIPGNVFSTKDTHFRISYAAEQRTLERGVEVLRRIAKG